MDQKDTIKRIIRASQEAIGSKPLVNRDVRLPQAKGKILTVTGIRRCGKSSLLRLEMAAQLARGVDRSRMFHMNFEDERLEASTETLTTITEAYHELHPEVPLNKAFIYLDEVQVMPGWERFVSRLSESEGATVRLSGSNSKMLSREIATTLRGRTLNTPLLPFSFPERMRLLGTSHDEYLPKQRSLLLRQVRDHLTWGGFPEVITADMNDRRSLLAEYFNVLLFRDLIERHGILQPVILKHFLKRMLSNATKPVSVNKVDNVLRSAGLRTTKSLLYDWLDIALDVHLLIRCDRFGASTTERLTSTTRFFATDNGLLTATASSFQDEWGKLLENAVAVESVRAGWAVTYYKEKRECDLILCEDGRPKHAVQVTWSMSDPDTRTRELSGLAEACDHFGFKEGTIITFEEREDIRVGKLRIRVLPFWEVTSALEK